MFIKNSPKLTKKLSYDIILIPNLSSGRVFIMEENKVNVRKLTLIALAVLALCVIVGALIFIFGEHSEPDTFYPKAYGDEVIYSFGNDVSPIHSTFLTLTSDGRFSMTFSMISSYIGIGSYTVDGDKLTLRTDDGEFFYTFFIEDGGNALAFDEENSSKMTWFSEMKNGIKLVLSNDPSLIQ